MIFLSRTSGTEISNKVSGLFLGQTIIGITAYAIMQGITVGMCTLCSQAYGAGKHKLVGIYFMRALLIGLLTCFPLWSVWIGVTPMVYYITGDIELAEGAGQYTRIYVLFRVSSLHILQSSKRVLTVSEYHILHHIL